MIERRDPVRIRQLALVSFATLVFSVVGGLSASSSEAVEICPQPDPAGCMVRCLAHKRRCFSACRERKKQCLHKVRVEAKSCVLDCRAAVTDQDPGSCKRDCIARAKEQAKSECLADRPVCIKQCNPQGCRRRCGQNVLPVDRPNGGTGRPMGAPVAHAPVVAALTAEAAPVCEPPVDNECLDGCAIDLRSCALRVREDIRGCVASCGELHGEERRVCIGDCAAVAREGGRACVDAFRQCVTGCRDILPVPDPTTAE